MRRCGGGLLPQAGACPEVVRPYRALGRQRRRCRDAAMRLVLQFSVADLEVQHGVCVGGGHREVPSAALLSHAFRALRQEPARRLQECMKRCGGSLLPQAGACPEVVGRRGDAAIRRRGDAVCPLHGLQIPVVDSEVRHDVCVGGGRREVLGGAPLSHAARSLTQEPARRSQDCMGCCGRSLLPRVGVCSEVARLYRAPGWQRRRRGDTAMRRCGRSSPRPPTPGRRPRGTARCPRRGWTACEFSITGLGSWVGAPAGQGWAGSGGGGWGRGGFGLGGGWVLRPCLPFSKQASLLGAS